MRHLASKIIDSSEFELRVEELLAGGANIDLHSATELTAPATDDELFTYDLSATTNKRMTLANLFKVINSLTTDSSPDAAADYLVTYDASAAAAKKVLLETLAALPRGYIDGCTLSNGTDTTNDIDIAAGVCRDSTNAVNITVPALTGKQLDANWAAGSSAGMRNSGAAITNTTYHIWAARTAASATADIYAHTSTVAATVLTALQAETGGSSYAYLRLIGSIVRSSGSIVQFTQYPEGRILVKTPVLDVDNASPGSSAVTATLVSVPVGLKMAVLFNAYNNASGGGFYVSSLDQDDAAPSATAAPLATVYNGNTSHGGQGIVVCNTSAQIRHRNGGAAFRLSVLGYWHPRGRDA